MGKRIVRTVSRLLLRSTLLGVVALSGCQSDPAEPAEDFAALQPIFFSATNLFDAQARQGLPAFEQRMDRMADAVLGRLDRGEITDPAALSAAGRALFYAAFVLHVGQHGLEDGYLTSAELLHPPRYAPAGDDRAELRGRMQRSSQLLDRAAALRPADSQVTTLQRSVKFNLEVLDGAPSQASFDGLIAAARSDRFSMFAAMILLRDPALHPLSAPYMEQLFTVVCSPQWYDCNRMGPPPPPDPSEPRWLTSKVAGPVLLSDLLAKRVELLITRADANPAMAPPALGEAQGRLPVANGALAAAMGNVTAKDLAVYPGGSTLATRQQRIDALRAGLDARVASMTPPPLPETTQYYKSQGYRAAYQCAACHIPRPDLPPSFNGVPK